MSTATTIVAYLVAALIAESVWETLKMIWQEGKVQVDRIGAIVLGLLLAFGARLDFLALIGVPLVIPYLGYVLTGLMLSRGANFVHDLWTKISNIAQTKLPTPTSLADTAKPSTPASGLTQPIRKLVKVFKVKKNK